MGEGDGTGCAVVNQLWAWLILNHEKYFSVKQQPIVLHDVLYKLLVRCRCIILTTVYNLLFIIENNKVLVIRQLEQIKILFFGLEKFEKLNF